MYERSLIHPDRNNIAPRIGFAYTPWSRLVVRGGYGVFFTHTVRQGREGLLGFNPPFLVDNMQTTSVSGAAAVASAALFQLEDGYPPTSSIRARSSPTVLRRAQDAHQRTPYIQQSNIGAQYQLRPDILVDVAYIGNKGTKLPGFRNLNQRAVIVNANGSHSAGARPYPAFGDIQWMENRVSSNYNSLQMRIEKRFTNGLTGTASYTWGKAITDAPDHISTSGGGAGYDTGVFREPQDSYNLRAERGPSEFDVTHRFVASYVWELPFGHGRRFGDGWNRAADFALGGWQITGIHVLQSGLALTPTIDASAVREPRRRTTGAAEPGGDSGAAGVGTHACALVQHGRVRQSRAPGLWQRRRGIMRGPGLANFDFSIAKTFSIDDRRDIQFRTEIFNAFNHANFGPPNLARESSGFGQILTAANARIIQLGVKFLF